MVKLFVFLRRRPELTPEGFWEAWQSDHALASAESRELTRRVRRYVQNRAIPGAAIPELTLSDFDGVDELWFDTLADLTAALEEPATRERRAASAAALTAPGGAIALVAEESVQFDRGFGAVKFIGLSHRAAGFATREDWIRYWIDVHGPLAHGIEEFTRYYGRYVHNYVLPSELGAGGLEPGFDGIVEEWLESVEAFTRCLEEPKYLETVRPDEVRFVDFSRSHMLVTEEHVIRG